MMPKDLLLEEGIRADMCASVSACVFSFWLCLGGGKRGRVGGGGRVGLLLEEGIRAGMCASVSAFVCVVVMCVWGGGRDQEPAARSREEYLERCVRQGWG
jgi:hypothetical protein